MSAFSAQALHVSLTPAMMHLSYALASLTTAMQHVSIQGQFGADKGVDVRMTGRRLRRHRAAPIGIQAEISQLWL